MKVAILLYDGVTALDAVGPYEVLCLLPGAEVRFVASVPGPKRTDSGFLTLHADHGLADGWQPDVIVVPGSSNGTMRAAADEAVLRWLRAAHAGARWTTSVCSGALILGAAGLLRGKRATTHWAASKYLQTFGAEASGERVVDEGEVITAAGVTAGIDMALHLAARAAGERQAQAIQLIIEYDPRPPFDSGSVEKAAPEVRELAGRQLAAMMRAGAAEQS